MSAYAGTTRHFKIKNVSLLLTRKDADACLFIKIFTVCWTAWLNSIARANLRKQRKSNQ